MGGREGQGRRGGAGKEGRGEMGKGVIKREERGGVERGRE